MTLPVYQNAGTFVNGTTGAITPGIPASTAAGDFLLLLVESANEVIATPSGWTQVASSPQGTGTAAAAGGVRLGVFWKIAGSSESSPSIADTGNHTTAQIFRFTGVDGTTPIHATAGSVLATANTAITCPAVTTTVNDCLIVNAIANDRDLNSTTSLSAWTNASLSSLTAQADQTVNSAMGGGIGLATGGLATAGGSGQTAVTNAVSVTAAMITVALAPTQSASLNVTDSGSGSDALTSLGVSLALSDTGAGLDLGPAPSAELPILTDSGSGTDAVFDLAALLSLSDAGSGADALAALSALLAVLDAGTGVDSLSTLAVEFSLTDTGLGGDEAQVLILQLIQDAGAGLDGLVNLAVSVPVPETGAGVDAASAPAVALNLADSGLGSDAPTLSAELSVGDTGTASDTPAVGAQLAVTETASGLDAPVIRVDLSLLDAGTGSDLIAALENLLSAITDAASGLDNLAVAVSLPVPDSGAGLDTLGALAAVLSLLDASIGLDGVSVSGSGGGAWPYKPIVVRFALSQRAMAFAFASRAAGFGFARRAAFFTLNGLAA